MDINRDALLLYLRDLRDLEMAKYHIKNMIAREEATYQKIDVELQKTNYWEARFENQISQPKQLCKEIIPNSTLEILGHLILSIAASIIGGFIGFCLICLAVWLAPIAYDCIIWENGGFFRWIGIIVFGGITLVSGIGGAFLSLLSLLEPICSVYSDISENSKAKKKNEEIQKENKRFLVEFQRNNEQIRARNQDLENRVRQHNAEEQVRQNQNAQRRVQLRQKWNERKQFLEAEKGRVEGLLKKAYDENILPAPYRELAPLYYIYDYMSTSRASFEDTLMHEHLENGFQRILTRLDEIVENQATQLFSLRRIEAQNAAQIRQNASMLDSLEQMDYNNQAALNHMNHELGGINDSLGGIRDNTYQTSQYAKQASQYAGIAATYSAANAYFSLANYLKN